MFADAYRFRILLLAALITLPLITLFALRPWEGPRSQSDKGEPVSASTGAPSVETMKQSLARDRQLLGESERYQAALRAEVIKRRKLFQEGQVAKEAVIEAEQ